MTEPNAATGEDPRVAMAIRAGDASTFATLAERHRRELRIHCYRMLGRVDDAEDIVQETLARAWRRRASFEGRSSFRAWLYRIATNACLDTAKQARRRGSRASTQSLTFDDVPWLQPIPDELIGSDDEPDAVAIARETVELAFLVAIQELAPRPRAVLILRDVLGWSAAETAEVLDGSVAAVNSALQRARATLGRTSRDQWRPRSAPTDAERELLQRYMDAHARGDAEAVLDLLGENVSFTMPPDQARIVGRVDVGRFFDELFGPDGPGEWRLVPTRANGQLAAANYIRAPGSAEFRAATLDVLHFEDGRIVEITTFFADVFPSFGLPEILEG